MMLGTRRNAFSRSGASDASVPADVVLSVRQLSVAYVTRRGPVQAVRDVSFDLHGGESLALIGESGSGKTTLGMAINRLLGSSAQITTGEVLYQRQGKVTNILTLNKEQLRRFHWQECAIVFQSALNSLNPVLRVADQFVDTARAHGQHDRGQIEQRASHLLRLVQLDPGRVLHAYPHELSGGMRQRVLLALGLLLEPQVLVLDEPTTALDILTQRVIIETLRQLKQELRFSMIFISHDLSLAAELADRVATMYAGRIIELGSVRDIFYHTRHPYTLGLLQSVPPLRGTLEDLRSIPGSPPDLITLPSGCKFHPRCPLAGPECAQEDPPAFVVGDEHTSACLRWQEVRSPRGEEAAIGEPSRVMHSARTPRAEEAAS
ncbi:MAG: ABC transporter ATP-binding protein [Chloroflexi bacterium]|nr:ABC transporter ATP-binding protein [Chloroflexota bacterium]